MPMSPSGGGRGGDVTQVVEIPFVPVTGVEIGQDSVGPVVLTSTTSAVDIGGEDTAVSRSAAATTTATVMVSF